MTRLIGAALIMAAALSLGLQRTAAERARIDALSELSRLLAMARAELSIRRTPIPELLCILRESAKPLCAEFFSAVETGLCQLGERDFADIWGGCAKRLGPVLGGEAAAVVYRLGSVLGRYELSEQLKALCAAEGELAALCGAAKAAYPAAKRLNLGLSSSAAALAVILLL